MKESRGQGDQTGIEVYIHQRSRPQPGNAAGKVDIGHQAEPMAEASGYSNAPLCRSSRGVKHRSPKSKKLYSLGSIRVECVVDIYPEPDVEKRFVLRVAVLTKSVSRHNHDAFSSFAQCTRRCWQRGLDTGSRPMCFRILGFEMSFTIQLPQSSFHGR